MDKRTLKVYNEWSVQLRITPFVVPQSDWKKKTDDCKKKGECAHCTHPKSDSERAGKTMLAYTNLFSTNDYKNNDKIIKEYFKHRYDKRKHNLCL